MIPEKTEDKQEKNPERNEFYQEQQAAMNYWFGINIA